MAVFALVSCALWCFAGLRHNIVELYQGDVYIIPSGFVHYFRTTKSPHVSIGWNCVLGATAAAAANATKGSSSSQKRKRKLEEVVPAKVPDASKERKRNLQRVKSIQGKVCVAWTARLAHINMCRL